MSNRIVATGIAVVMGVACGTGSDGDARPGADDGSRNPTGGPPDGAAASGRPRPPGPIPPTGPLEGDPCSYTLAEYRERVAGEDSIPEWAAIDCYTRDLVRKPLPRFIKRYNMAQDESLIRKPRESQLQWDHFDVGSSNPAVNMASGFLSAAPWFDLMTQQPYTYPLSPTHLDRKLRGNAPFFITDKLKGWVNFFVQFYPPDTVVPGVVDVASWKRWVTDFYVPEKITEAKYAERLKFEAYDPFVGEAEIMINTLPFTRTLPVREKVEMGQWLIDTLLAAVRPHFKGQLWGVSYTNYAVTGDEWEGLSFKGYDRVVFGLFPECNLAETKKYLDKQLRHQTKVLQNSGGLPWISGEVFVKKSFFANQACLSEAEYAVEEPKIYQAIIDSIERAPTKPVGLLVDHYLITQPESFKVIEAYWNSKPN